MKKKIASEINLLISNLEDQGLYKEAEGLKEKFRNFRKNILQQKQKNLSNRYDEGTFQDEASAVQKARMKSLQNRQQRVENLQQTSNQLGDQSNLMTDQMVTRLREMGYQITAPGPGGEQMGAQTPKQQIIQRQPQQTPVPQNTAPQNPAPQQQAAGKQLPTTKETALPGISPSYSYFWNTQKGGFTIAKAPNQNALGFTLTQAGNQEAYNKLVQHYSSQGYTVPQ